MMEALDETQRLIAAALLMLVGAGGLLVFWWQYSRASKTTRAAAPRAPLNRPHGSGPSQPEGASLPIGGEYEEEEMPTVVMAVPPAPVREAVEKAKTARPRTSGATIIAFDDED